MKKIFVIILICSYLGTFAQENYPQDAFRSPLDIPLVLAGTFGELRSNHFHSGIDIKTQQREGLPIYAIADGSITRIKISLWGYGKVMYLSHANGYTSVYGHLKKLSPALEAYLKKIQYEKQSYEVELFPELGELTVKKGDLIAYSGNTGSSSGPHLHFEIRKSVNENPTNPLLYNYDVADATKPNLLKLYAYALSDDGQVNKSADKVAVPITRQKDGTYKASEVSAFGTIGFGIIAYDRQDRAANKNGVYKVQQIVNGKLCTDYDFEQFSFSETRLINTFIDYDHYGKYRQKIQKLFKSPPNNLSIFKTLENDGKIEVKEGLDYSVEILIKDFKDNVVKLVVPVTGRKTDVLKQKTEEKTENYIIAKKPNNYDLGVANVYFPANTFYEDFYIDLEKGEEVVKIHNNRVAVDDNFTITFDVTKYDELERSKMFIARLDERLRPSYNTTYKRGNTFTIRTRNLGSYTLEKDTVAPRVTAKNFKDKQWLNNFQYLSLRITDNLSGIDTYSATINGKWILMEYEPKRNTITYNFDDSTINEKECNLEVVVKDNVGNETVFKSTFFRK